MIGHAGDVIANYTWERVFFRFVLIAVRQGCRMRHPVIEQVGDDALGVVYTHGIAGLSGGLLVGLLADPNMIEYLGLGKTASVSGAGLFYGHPKQLAIQAVREVLDSGHVELDIEVGAAPAPA